MIKTERQQTIKAWVHSQGQVDVASLSAQLNVSEVTVRSDLEQLEKEGCLKRTHGGAVCASNGGNHPHLNGPFYGKVPNPNRRKEKLGKLASLLIQEGGCIF